MTSALGAVFALILTVLSAASATGVTPPSIAIVDPVTVDAHTIRMVLDIGESPALTDATLTLAIGTRTAPDPFALPLRAMPSRLPLLLDLEHGVISAGGVRVGTFAPLPPLRENLRLSLAATVQAGGLEATAHTTVELLLPTVFVPGYRNERGSSERKVLQAMVAGGYVGTGAAPSVYWVSYPTGTMSLPTQAAAFAKRLRDLAGPLLHATRINVVGYSTGGLVARWLIAQNVDGWASTVDRLVLIATPNEGMPSAYVAHQSLRALPIFSWIHSDFVLDLYPTFPYWRADASQPWAIPPDGGAATLAALNARPLPASVRVYLLYGNSRPDGGGFATVEGLTGHLPGASLTYGPGDGFVLTASAEGLPIHGNGGVPTLRDRVVCQIDVGAVYHTHVLEAALPWVIRVLRDRWDAGSGAPAPTAASCPSVAR